MSDSKNPLDTFRFYRGEPTYTLSEQEAFLAMTLFVNQFYSTAGDDLPTLMMDITIHPSYRGTMDPAAWEDWIECVRVVKGEAPQGDTWRAMGEPDIER
jgi:hypothetical protein